ncbi:unnamed protein product, partial [Symbiodinium necroappetens]
MAPGMVQTSVHGKTDAATTRRATTSGTLGRDTKMAIKDNDDWGNSARSLSTSEGLGYFTSWVSARFLDLEVARRSESTTPSTIVFMLAYEKSDALYRRPKRTNFAHMTEHDRDPANEEDSEHNDEAIPQEVAEALMTYQSAKEKYRAQQRARETTDGDKPTKDGDRDGDQRGAPGGGDREAKVRAIKARSFCGGCGRRGHWHKDDECPLNRGDHAKGDSGVKNIAMTNVMPADVFTLKHMS